MIKLCDGERNGYEIRGTLSGICLNCTRYKAGVILLQL